MGAALMGIAAVATIVGRRNHAVPLSIADPQMHWAGGGFVEMVPPIRLPTSLGGYDHITVWLRVPDGRPVRVEHDGERLTLVYPPGTVADRVEMREPSHIDGAHAWRVTDVRGTRLDDDGRERFHVLQAAARDGLSLAGFEWRRDDPSGVRAANAGLEELLRRGRLRDVDERKRAQAIDRLLRLNDCQPCHEHDRSERTRYTEGGPRRATDRAGFYVILSVLADAAPLENHRPREANVDDPFVTVSCGEDEASLVTTDTGPRYTCPDDRVPFARMDVARALAAGQPHAGAVCSSRRYLHEHMDDEARAAFAPSFAECGIRR
jgi:hypothetical protein